MTAEFMLTSHTNTYQCPLDGHPWDDRLNGVGIYFDKDMFGPVCALMVWDKFFVDTIGVNKKNSRNAGMSNFSKRYPYHEPMNP